MLKLLFVTTVDLSGDSGGEHSATKDIILALAEQDQVELSLLCPRPSNDMPVEIRKQLSSDNIRFFYKAAGKSMIGSHLAPQVDLLFKGIKNIKQYRGHDALIVRHGLVTISPLLLSKVFHLPYIVLSRGGEGDSREKYRFTRLLKALFWLNMRFADYVYTATLDRKEMVDAIRKPTQTEAAFLPNAVDPDLFSPIDQQEARSQIKYDLDDNEFVVGYVGSFLDGHALPELIEAVANLIQEGHQVKLVLVGQGDNYEKCRSLVKYFDISESVIFTGWIDHEDVKIYISACDILYGVTKAKSSSMLKCCEYLACSRPIIGSDISEFEFVKELDAGWLLSEISSEEIQDVIINSKNTPRSNRIAKGTRGREYVLNNRTWRGQSATIISQISNMSE